MKTASTDVVEISAAEAMRMEPALHCVAACIRPRPAIVDSHALMLAYLGDAEAAGAMLALKSSLEKVIFTGQDFELQVGETENQDGNARQQRRAARAQRRAPDRRLSRRQDPPGTLCQGQLLLARRAPALFAPGLPGARARRPGRARDPGPRRAGALRAGRGMGGADQITRSTRAAPIASTPRSGATGRGLRTARLRRATPASGRRSPRPGSRPPIS